MTHEPDSLIRHVLLNRSFLKPSKHTYIKLQASLYLPPLILRVWTIKVDMEK